MKEEHEGHDEPTARASTPPVLDTVPSADGPSAISEKARGKMKEPRSASMDSLDRVAATGIGRNGFVPTQEWVSLYRHLSYLRS